MDADCELRLDFRVLIPPTSPDAHKPTGETLVLTALIDAGQRQLLLHPVCQAFLHLKWHRVRAHFLVSLLFHAIFVLTITANFLTKFRLPHNCSDFNNSTSEPLNSKHHHTRSF